MNSKLLGSIALAGAAVITTAVLLGDEAQADKIVVYRSTGAKVTKVILEDPGDGGCVIQAWGEAPKADGGVPFRSHTEPRHLGGANRTRCLDVMSDSAALWKTEEGL